MDELHIRPMTGSEFDSIRSTMVHEYAVAKVAVGEWTADDAESRAEQDTQALLPAGVDTPGMSMLVAETDRGAYVGRVWLALEHQSGSGGGAWIYDIEVSPEFRGRGYGRALLTAAEQEAASHGVASIGLNVHGPNLVARSLYDSAGYDVTALQMRKPLASPGAAR